MNLRRKPTAKTMVVAKQPKPCTRDYLPMRYDHERRMWVCPRGHEYPASKP